MSVHTCGVSGGLLEPLEGLLRLADRLEELVSELVIPEEEPYV